MIESPEKTKDKAKLYPRLCRQVAGLIESCPRPLPAMANISALLWAGMEEINWCGFYLYNANEHQLILGPFQGKAACIQIPDGKGVCGTAAVERKLQLVPDVHQFPGHIACDDTSRSEIVIPMLCGDRLLGVLDIDSPVPNRFDQLDADGLTGIVELLTNEDVWDGSMY